MNAASDGWVITIGTGTYNELVAITRKSTISNSEIYGAGADGSGFEVAQGNSISILRCSIHNNGRNGVMFIDSTGGPHLLEANQIYRNGWNGVRVARQHEITLRQNNIRDNGTASGTTGGRFGILRERTPSTGLPGTIVLTNNSVVNNRGPASTGESSLDLGNFDQILDSTDSGNKTTIGTEGFGVTSFIPSDI